MRTPPKQHPITPPDLKSVPLYADQALAGPDVDPVDRLRICTSDFWEKIIATWAESQVGDYTDAHRLGGAGDMGYDIVAVRYDGSWDCYQAKHYEKHLTPANACTEIGKVIYHCWANSLTLPSRYIFVAPQDCNADLFRLMQRPDDLRAELVGNWDTRCRKNITAKQDISLKGDLLQYLNQFDFSVFSSLSPLKLIRHIREKTPYYQTFFGGTLPDRPLVVEMPPPQSADFETIYIGKLLDAYVDSGESSSHEVETLPANLLRHYTRARQSFYSAESLRIYARECAPTQFEALLNDFYYGIIDDLERDYPHGLDRLREVAAKAVLLKSSLGIETRMSNQDRIGLCHHLANDLDRDVTWVRDDQ